MKHDDDISLDRRQALKCAADVVDLAEGGFPLAGGRIDIVAGAGVPPLV